MEQYIGVLVGNVGTGKTTYAKRTFVNGEVIISVDELGSGIQADIKLYEILDKSIHNGISVIIDATNCTIKARRKYVQIARNKNIRVIAYDFGSGTEKSLKNRLNNPGTHSEEKWIKSHRGIQEKYQSPTIEEGFVQVINMS